MNLKQENTKALQTAFTKRINDWQQLFVGKPSEA